MPSSANHSHDRFATTRWSLVMQLDAPQTKDAQTALVELCTRYWYPVYAYVRQCAHAPAIAQDITRSFLQDLLQHFRAGGERPAQGQFRRFLIARLNAFLADDWREAIKDEVLTEFVAAPADLELRYQRDNANATTPEQAYQRSFALEVVELALKRLRDEARKAGHLGMYEALEPFLGKDPSLSVQADLANALQTRPLAIVVALKRLRQRFRKLVGDELSDTVNSEEDFAAEQQTLHAVLREPRRS